MASAISSEGLGNKPVSEGHGIPSWEELLEYELQDVSHIFGEELANTLIGFSCKGKRVFMPMGSADVPEVWLAYGYGDLRLSGGWFVHNCG